MDGGAVSLVGGYATSSTKAVGGEIVVHGSRGGSYTGGIFSLSAGVGTGTSSGAVIVKTVNAGAKGASGKLSFTSGTTSSGASGSIELYTGDATNGEGGDILLSVGKSLTHVGGDVRGVGGDSTPLTGGAISFNTGEGTYTSSGAIVLQTVNA